MYYTIPVTACGGRSTATVLNIAGKPGAGEGLSLRTAPSGHKISLGNRRRLRLHTNDPLTT